MIEQLTQILHKLNEKEAALAVVDALGRHSTEFHQYDELARSCFKMGESRRALDFGLKALKLIPKNNPAEYPAKSNVISAACHSNEPELAMKYIRELEVINPNDDEVQLNKSYAFFLMNQKDKAEAILRKALNNPRTPEDTKNRILFNLGTYELMRDEFQTGMRHFLIDGRKLKHWEKPKLDLEPFEGKIEPGRTVIMMAEAGIGDEFVNVRFMKHFRDLGMNPVWMSGRADIRKIFERCGFNTIKEGETIEGATWLHSMDAPIYLNLEHKDLWYGPYLSADKNIVDDTREIFSDKKLKIGLRWQGNPGYEQDLHRTLPFDQLWNVVDHIDADFYSLQRDDGAGDCNGYPITRLDHIMTDYDTTLALIDHLDLVITSCTSVAHAAAAMGKQTIVMPPISAYYTWCHSSEQSPWYGDHVKIIRQQKQRSWEEPFNQLHEYLLNKYQ